MFYCPLLQDEKERIESLGGCVVWFGAWRVNGTLSVSRAIGDIEHKPYICGNPDVIEYEFDGRDNFYYAVWYYDIIQYVNIGGGVGWAWSAQ